MTRHGWGEMHIKDRLELQSTKNSRQVCEDVLDSIEYALIVPPEDGYTCGGSRYEEGVHYEGRNSASRSAYSFSVILVSVIASGILNYRGL